jgi:hypothetical protein
VVRGQLGQLVQLELLAKELWSCGTGQEDEALQCDAGHLAMSNLGGEVLANMPSLSGAAPQSQPIDQPGISTTPSQHCGLTEGCPVNAD